MSGTPRRRRPGALGRPAAARAARLAADPEDVLALLGLAPGAQPALPGLGAAAAMDDEERAVLGALASAPRHVGEVARAAGLPAGRTLAALLTLELEGLAEQRPGQFFQRRAA